jgi:hypothetical protein
VANLVTRQTLNRTANQRRVVPDPGLRLRLAVDSVLAGLNTDVEPDPRALHRFDDTLRGALAWTAAVGGTCQVSGAVRCVRTARRRLDMADADEARVALLSAREVLIPGQRGPA